MLFMSLKEIRRLMLPTPDFNPAFSSLTILCVFGRGLGRLGTTAPALSVKSDRNDSLSKANFLKALSKSTSFKLPVLFIWMPLIVVLLLLLSVPLHSGESGIEAIESRASSDNLDKRW